MEHVLFEWDEVKNIVNEEKHGVSFEEAQMAFSDPWRIIYVDVKHSGEEQRLLCFGIVNDQVMTVRFTYREHSIRIIGAGYWRSGRKIYEKEKNNIH